MKIGWRVWVEDESLLLVWTGAAWEDFALLVTALQNLALLGIGTTADATNPLAAKLNNILFTAKYDAEGGDGSLRYKMNKEAAVDVLSLLLQTNFSGRAEIGLVGDDDLLFKVSPDGSAWIEALRIDKDNGSLTLGAPEGPLLHHDPAAADPNDGGYKFALSYSNSAWTNGPVGEENYIDDVWGFGINAASAGGNRIDPTKPSIAWTFESKFYQSTFGMEAHLQLIDTAGVNHRVWSGFFPHDGGAGSVAGMRADTINMDAYSGASGQFLQFVALAKTISMVGTTHFLKSTNNVTMFRQHNAANSAYLNLPFIDNLDKIRLENPTFIVGNRVDSKFLIVQPSTANANDTGLQVNMPTGTFAELFAAQAVGAIDGTLTVLIGNNNSASASASARLNIYANGASAGDVQIRMQILGVTTCSLGVDNSDGDKFKICAGSPLGTNDRITIDANSIAFGLPAKLPSTTVGTVPSASAAGAGSMIYVSDESGGAVLAFSDGTDWRRVTDRAVVS